MSCSDSVALAGRRRAGRHLLAGDHRPDSLSATGRALTLARQWPKPEATASSPRGHARCVATAQGSGRLIRRLSDRGVVAVLDPRLITARYGSYLRTSMPEMWQTSEREVVIGALRRLSGQA